MAYFSNFEGEDTLDKRVSWKHSIWWHNSAGCQEFTKPPSGPRILTPHRSWVGMDFVVLLERKYLIIRSRHVPYFEVAKWKGTALRISFMSHLSAECWFWVGDWDLIYTSMSFFDDNSYIWSHFAFDWSVFFLMLIFVDLKTTVPLDVPIQVYEPKKKIST